MRWITDRDEGAVLVWIALLLVVLIGFVGLAVDVGALFQERRELRNGADAGALAVAEDCALEAKPCDSATADATSAWYANENANDGASGIESVELDLAAQQVRVTTHTIEAATGSDEMRPFFMGVLGFGGKTVHASATARWGVPRSMGNVLPLVVSECEWHDEIIDQPVFLYFHGGQHSEGVLECHAVPGHDADNDGSLPGGFGWLDAPDCEMDLDTDSWLFSADPGVNIPQGCKDLIYVGAEIIIPWFDDVSGQGSGGTYHIAGFGALEITGFRFPGYAAPSPPPCTGDEICITGIVRQKVVDIGEFGTGTSHGVVLVKLVE